MINELMAIDLVFFIRSYLRSKCFDLSYLIGLSLYFFDHQLQHEILFLNKICIGLIEQLTFLAKGVKHKGIIFQCIDCFADIILLLRLRFPKGKQVLFLGYHGSAFLLMRHRNIIDPIQIFELLIKAAFKTWTFEFGTFSGHTILFLLFLHTFQDLKRVSASFYSLTGGFKIFFVLLMFWHVNVRFILILIFGRVIIDCFKFVIFQQVDVIGKAVRAQTIFIAQALPGVPGVELFGEFKEILFVLRDEGGMLSFLILFIGVSFELAFFLHVGFYPQGEVLCHVVAPAGLIDINVDVADLAGGGMEAVDLVVKLSGRPFAFEVPEIHLLHLFYDFSFVFGDGLGPKSMQDYQIACWFFLSLFISFTSCTNQQRVLMISKRLSQYCHSSIPISCSYMYSQT